MLNLDAQKRLTLFLGECWHELNFNTFNSTTYAQCFECGMHKKVGFGNCDEKDYRLDFSDWRVSGRILVQATHVGLCPSLLFDDDGHWQLSLSGIAGIGHSFSNPHIEDNWYDTPQEAIAQAIDAYLQEKGEGK